MTVRQVTNLRTFRLPVPGGGIEERTGVTYEDDAGKAHYATIKGRVSDFAQALKEIQKRGL